MLQFVTGNKHKIASAKIILSSFNIDFKTVNLPLIEIQSNSIEEIAIHKAKQAFDELKKPLIIKDDGWAIDALNGFPGPYMKYINEWFTVEDYQNLLRNKKSKKITFTEVICYIDSKQTKLFTGNIFGKFQSEPQGKANHPFMELACFRKDGMTMAEATSKGLVEFDKKDTWEKFAKWFLKNKI